MFLVRGRQAVKTDPGLLEVEWFGASDSEFEAIGLLG